MCPSLLRPRRTCTGCSGLKNSRKHLVYHSFSGVQALCEVKYVYTQPKKVLDCAVLRGLRWEMVWIPSKKLEDPQQGAFAMINDSENMRRLFIAALLSAHGVTMAAMRLLMFLSGGRHS